MHDEGGTRYVISEQEAFSESMMCERWDFRWEAGDNSVKLDAGIKGRRFMSSCVRWRCIGEWHVVGWSQESPNS